MAAEAVSVRVMRREDVSTLVEIDAMASGRPRAEYIQGKAEQALNTEHGMVISLVAESNNTVVGFLMGQVFLGEFGIPETTAQLDTVGVRPDLQGKGVARMLFEEFVTHTRKIGVECIRTMLEWEQWDLLGFFRQVGFVPGTAMVLEQRL